MVEDVKKAIAAGIAVGNIDQVLGSDMTTPDSQVAGLSSNVAFVPSELGRKIGDLVVTACADLGRRAHPCNVGYIWSVKAAALDTALKKAFDEAIAPHPEIKVVSDTGESFYTTALGLKAAQDIVAAHPDVSVIVSADQAITGAVQAVKDIKDKVRLVGYGGGAVALQGIASGERFGTVMQMPATEGGQGTKQLIEAIRSGTPAAGRRSARDAARRRRRDQGQRRLPSCRSRSGRAEAGPRRLTPWPARRTAPSTSRSAARQVLRGDPRPRRCLDRRPGRLGPRLRRRERRRQVHAGQDHRRRLPAGPGRPGPARDDRSRSGRPREALDPRHRPRRPGGRPRPAG